MEHGHPDLIPRRELVATLIPDTTNVVFVHGPSGAGKSVLLQQAAATARAERYVSGPHEVMWSDPLLHLLLRSLSEVVAEIIDGQRTAERFGKRLSGVIERMVVSRGRELAHAAGREILNFVRSRLGPEAGQAVADAVAALWEESAESLGARLDRARAEVARDVIVDFAGEVVALSGDRPVLIALDRCERLDDANLRLLADLAEVLPDGAQIWVAARTESVAGRFLAQTDASVLEVPPFDAMAVGDILEQRGLSPASVDDVLERTDGTALDVQAYVSLLEVEAPRDAGANEVVALDTAQRLSRLSEDAHSLTLRLAALSDPLPEPYLLRLADADPERLAKAMRELHDQGLLTAHATGQWFHERRSAAILQLAGDEDRTSAITEAATAVWEHLQAGGDASWLVELADLAARADDLAEGDETLRAVLALDAGALAVVAGLIELTQPGLEAVDGQALLNYARATYPSGGRELECLQRLNEAEIVVVAHSDLAAAAVLRLSGLARAVAVGRIARAFGHMPIPNIASAGFEQVLVPRIGPFVDGHYGVGRPSLRDLSYMALGREEDPWRAPPSSERREAGPALIARAGFAGRPLYGAFRFSSTPDRDRALDAISGLDIEFLDARVAVSTALGYPMGVVPADRFLHAAGRVLGRKMRPSLTQIKEALESPLSFGEFADLRVRTLRTLRDLAGASMRGAMELDLPLSLHWMADERSALVIEVHGGREVSCEHADLARPAVESNPYQFFHLASELGLRADESITSVIHHLFSDEEHAPTRFDPVLAEIADRRAKATAYNRAQPQLLVRFDHSLPKMIRDSFFREMADARALASALPLLGRDDWELPATAKYIVLAIEPPDPGWVAGARSTLVWAEGPSPSGDDECHVAYQGEEGRPAPLVGGMVSVNEEALRQLPDFDQGSIVRSGSAVTTFGVADLLAHRNEDLDFRHADDE